VASPMNSRFSKSPEEPGLTRLARAKAIRSITRLEGLLLGGLQQLFGQADGDIMHNRTKTDMLQ
jgi:hypothetical protein